MPRSKVIDLSDLADGIHEFGPVNLANNVAKIGVEIDRCTTLTPDIWPNAATTNEFRLEVSWDGGATWRYMGGSSGYGGIIVKGDGTEATFSGFRVQIPSGNGRRARGSLTITNGPLRTTMYVWTDK